MIDPQMVPHPPVFIQKRQFMNALIDRLRRREAHLKPEARGVSYRVEARDGDGTLMLRALDGECIERANPCSSYVGQLIDRPCNPPINTTGAAGIPMASMRRAVNTLDVEKLVPNIFHPGDTALDVDVQGYGFMEITVIEFLLEDDETINPDITINSITYVSPTHLTVNITVDPSADLIDADSAGVAFDNPGRPA